MFVNQLIPQDIDVIFCTSIMDEAININNLKEDLNSQLKRAIESKDEPKVALFKNSFKSINALEYILFKWLKSLTLL